MVMVFDENGNQIEQFQGTHAMVKDLILCNDCTDTEYFINEWQTPGKKKITRDEFEKGL
jgi:hypothetical protein